MYYVLITVCILFVLLLLFLFFVSQKPNTFRYEREATFNVPPEKIFPVLNDFHQWQIWSPWEKLDPNMTRTHSGNEAGVGAIYSWEGNKKVGEGRMEILESHPSSKLIIKLDFIKPFQASNISEFHLKPTGTGTHIIWAMHGAQPFMSKLMCTLINLDKLIGKDFETGLNNLKTHVEAK